MAEVERYYKDGKLAVLISPGYGAGWSTWEGIEVALDKRIVEKFINEHPNEENMKEFMNQIGYQVYMGGYKDLKVVYIPKGKAFMIREYDGSESIITSDDMIIA